MKEAIKHQNKKAKGKIKIELFENGKKVKEHNDTNFVARGAYNIMNLYAYDVLYAGKSGGKPSYSTGISSVFSKILLSDATHAESPENEFYFKGNLIGFGDSRESGGGGSNLLQGIYNSLESSQSRDSVKYVFDFTNNYSNGTFRSIYFGNSTNLYTLANGIFMPAGNSRYAVDDIKMIKILNGTHYVLRVNGIFNVYNQNFELLQTYNYPSASQITDFEILGDYIYFTSRSSSLQLRRASLNDLSTLETVDIPGITNLGGIAYSTKEDRFYISNDVSIFVCDTQFNLLDTVQMRYRLNNSYSAMTYLEQSNEIIMNNLVYNIDDNDFGIWYSPITGTGESGISLNLCTGLYDNENMYFARNVAVLPLASIGSRSLLDAPITKTENQTMKITYEFSVE